MVLKNNSKLYEEEIVLNLRNKYKLKIEVASFAKGLIPNYILLDRTRNIHSYIIICKKSEECFTSVYFNHNYNLEKNLMDISRIQYSELGRPLFLIYEELNSNNLKVIDVSEIKELLLTKKFSVKNLFQLEIDFDQVAPIIKEEL